MSLSEILPEDKRRLHEIELQLVELERGNPHIYASDIYLGLNEMSNRLVELDKLILKEPKNKRDDCKRRVVHLKNSYTHIKTSLDAICKKRNISTQRNELFGENSYDIEGGNDTSALENSINESNSLNRSSNMISNYLTIGKDTLDELISQKDRIKVVQRKVFDMLNYLGISNSMMKTVEGRENIDKYIVYVGMILTLIILFLLWWYFKR